MTHQKNPVESLREIEELSVEIHKLYCVQFEKDHGKPYWTEGDYSKLEERVKEYDRNIARFIISRDSSHHEELLVEMLEEVGEDVSDIHFGEIDKGENFGWNQNNNRFRSILLAKKKQ